MVRVTNYGKKKRELLQCSHWAFFSYIRIKYKYQSTKEPKFLE